MGYLHINNLYKARDVLLFKEVYALEKVHGTSAHIKLADGALTFFPGGESKANFEALFDHATLLAGMSALGSPEVTVYGEAYGGKCQRMSHTYGDALRLTGVPPRIASFTDLPRGRWAPTWSAVASMCVLALSLLILAATIVVCWGRP